MVPGLGGSGAEHWQSHWQREIAHARIVEQADWDRPESDAWVTTLNRYVEGCRKPVVLVAHSLGCALVAHWAARVRYGQAAPPSAPISAAMLVAPADVDSEAHTPDIIRSFAPMPLARLPFPSLVVASADDPFVSPERSAQFAGSWDSDLVSVGPMGHLSSDSGCGSWPRGKTILSEFVHRQSVPWQ